MPLPDQAWRVHLRTSFQVEMSMFFNTEKLAAADHRSSFLLETQSTLLPLSAHCHSQTPLLCSVFVNIRKKNKTHIIPSSEANFLCLSWVCFLWTGLQGRGAMRRTVLALALSAEPMSLLPAVHRDRTVMSWESWTASAPRARHHSSGRLNHPSSLWGK